jgi:magnesium-transporting ATPase (P-type)
MIESFYCSGLEKFFSPQIRITKIYESFNVKRKPSTLEVQISKVVHIITVVAISMGVIVFLLANFLVGMGIRESFIFAIGIIVAFVPEGLLPTLV